MHTRWRGTVLLLLLFGCRHEEKQAAHFPQAPVIVISIDTLRADRLPMFGYGGVTTPHLDALRRDSILYRRAYAQAPLTLPSHLSMLSGQLPPEHGVRSNIGFTVDAQTETIPGRLRASGYATGAAVSAYVLRGSTGIAAPFDFYEDGVPHQGHAAVGHLQRSGRSTAGLALRWIEQQSQRPFFFFLHLFEPHSPYEPEPRFRAVVNAYDGEIATVDAIVGEFLDGLRRSDLYERSIIILLSDHGEGLNDHGEPEHGIFVYREAIHVPLLLKLPGGRRAGEAIDAPVSLTDLMPTVGELTGVAMPARVYARSLLAPAQAGRRIYSESLYPRIHLGWSELRSLIDGSFHFIEAPRPELYAAADQAEMRNVIAEQRRVFSSMREELAAFPVGASRPGAINPEDAQKLAALGYLSSTPAASSASLPDPKDRIGEIADMVRASDLLRQRRYDAAIDSFRAIVAKNPALSDGWNQLGVALEGAGRFEEAAEVYSNAIRRTPELAGEFALRRGAVLLRLERYDEAIAHARLAERTNPGSMHLLLARVAMAQKDHATAEAEARRAATDPAHRMEAQVLLAQNLAQQNRLEEAFRLLNELVRERDRLSLGPIESLEFVLGDVLGRMQRNEEAVAAFRREIEHFPANRQTYANLYLMLRVMERDREAEEILEQLVRNNYSGPTMLFAARTAAALGDEALASAWRRRAARLNSSKPASAIPGSRE